MSGYREDIEDLLSESPGEYSLLRDYGSGVMSTLEEFETSEYGATQVWEHMRDRRNVSYEEVKETMEVLADVGVLSKRMERVNPTYRTPVSKDDVEEFEVSMDRALEAQGGSPAPHLHPDRIR